MTSQAIRDPLEDHLITPQNAAFVFIDYQPEQLATVRSMDQELPRAERRLHGEDGEDVRRAGRPLDRQRRVRSDATDAA